MDFKNKLFREGNEISDRIDDQIKDIQHVRETMIDAIQ